LNAGKRIRLAEETAVVKLREYNLEPLEPYVKSDVKWKCRCVSCGGVVYPKLKNLQRGDGGCYKCGMQAAGRKNSLKQDQAIQVANKAGFTPLEPYKSALTKWKMLHHECGATVYPKLNTLSNIKDGRMGCAVCSGHQVARGINDLVTTNQNIASEAWGWDPTEVTAGSQKKLIWKCSEGHIWKAPVSTRTSGHGCPTCALTGFDPNKDGYLYFVTHGDWEMFQIGITNVPVDRLKDHKKLGWEVLELRGPMDGHLTQQWETAILRMLKTKGADLSNEKIAGKFDGYSEAWTKASLPVDSIKELMRLTDEFEENLGKRDARRGQGGAK
jgi:hypothetical protein